MSIFAYIKRIIRFVLSCLKPQTRVYPQISLLAPNQLLKNRVALITGGNSGIGFEIARSFINAGATVIIAGRNSQRISEKVELLRSEFDDKQCAFGLKMDVSDVNSLSSKFQEALHIINKDIDILVNNAGVNGGAFGDAKENEFDLVINTNLKGTFFLSQLFGHYLKEHNISGNILNICSSSSLRPATSAYGISKWGILGLTRGLARILTPYGITVNGIAPGPTATPMQGMNEEGDVSLESNLTGRYALPHEIGNMAVILVSNMSKMIVGDVIYMTGGSGIIYNGDISYNF